MFVQMVSLRNKSHCEKQRPSYKEKGNANLSQMNLSTRHSAEWMVPVSSSSGFEGAASNIISLSVFLLVINKQSRKWLKKQLRPCFSFASKKFEVTDMHLWQHWPNSSRKHTDLLMWKDLQDILRYNKIARCRTVPITC